MRLVLVFLLACSALSAQRPADMINQVMQGSPVAAYRTSAPAPVYEVPVVEMPRTAEVRSGSYLRPCCAGMSLWSERVYVPRSWIYWDPFLYRAALGRPYYSWRGLRGFVGVSAGSHRGVQVRGGVGFRRH